MTDCAFKKLTFEILVVIVGFCRQPDPPFDNKEDNDGIRRLEDIRGLSLVCSAFNDACSTFLFSSYTVHLHEVWSHLNGKFDRCYTAQRIAVLLRKAPYVRKLTIRDGRRLWPNNVNPEGPPLQLGLPEELWVALDEVTGVRKLVLWNDAPRSNGPRHIHQKLWKWMEARSNNRLSQIDLEGLWSPPKQAGIIHKLDCLGFAPLADGNVKFLKLLKAPKLTIINRDFPDIAPFRPGPEDGHLRDIRIYMIMDDWGIFWREQNRWTHLLDFSSVPSARVLVEMRSTKFEEYEGDLGKYGEFVMLCDVAMRIFSEDLAKFDVMRFNTEACLLINRYPGIKVGFQGHRVDEQEKREQLMNESREREMEVRALWEALIPFNRTDGIRRRWILNRIRRLEF